jgi:hypothetical protein
MYSRFKNELVIQMKFYNNNINKLFSPSDTLSLPVQRLSLFLKELVVHE